MNRAISLKTKILGISFLSLLLLAGAMTVMHFRDLHLAEQDAEAALRESSRIALHGAQMKQHLPLEKILTSLVNTDEAARFLANPQDRQSGIVLRGQLPFFSALRCARLTVYNASFETLLQETVPGLGKRPDRLPEIYRPLFETAAKDLGNHFYFRRNESGDQPTPAEYCGVAVVLDSKDAVAGFVEVSLDVATWRDDLAAITGSGVGFYDPAGKAFVSSTDASLFENIAVAMGKAPIQDGRWIDSVGGSHVLADRMPILAPDGQVIQWLWLTRDHSEEMAMKRNNLLLSTVVITAITLGCMVLLLTVVTRSILPPIAAAVRFAEAIATGDLNVRIEASQKDEIGDLARALSGMVSRLREVIADVRSATAQVASGGGELSGTAQQVSEGASEQAAIVATLSSAMEEMTSTVAQSADNARQTAGIAAKASADVAEGGRAVGETVSAMRTIAEKIEIIEEISRQTNLLALNAAIEAARAGGSIRILWMP